MGAERCRMARNDVLIAVLGACRAWLLRLATAAKEPVESRRSRAADRFSAGSCAAPRPTWGRRVFVRDACQEPNRLPQAGLTVMRQRGIWARALRRCRVRTTHSKHP